MIRVIAYKGETFFDRLIRRWTRSEYSHVALMCGEEIIEARINVGVRKTRWNNHTPCNYDVFDITPLITGAQETIIWQTAEKEIGKDYDLMGLLGFASKTGLHSKRRWFCSELVSYACAAGSVLVAQHTPHQLVSPEMLVKSKALKLVQSGRIE